MMIYPVQIPGSVELVSPFEPREILCAFHDIDGTHSLIRDWVPVMTLCIGYTIRYGLLSAEPEKAVPTVLEHREESFPEAYDFSVESAGLSALTQMEWAVRRGIQDGSVDGKGIDPELNGRIIEGILAGRETFPEIEEDPDAISRIREESSKLFRIYEKILLIMSRDRNLADARIHPEKWIVPGSMEFLRFLRDNGVRNYFVTGAVVENLPDGRYAGTMFEEVDVLGYRFGEGELLAGLEGSAWNRKLPKIDIMSGLAEKLRISPRNILVVGDGRSEIAAGRAMGGVTISRLPADATRARTIHRELQTNFIMERYDLNAIRKLFRKTSDRNP